MWGSGLSYGVSSGASGWILEAPVLYHGFYQIISPLVLPWLGKGIGKRRAVTCGNPLDCRINFGKRVRLTRKTPPVASPVIIRDPGHQKIAPSFLRGSGGGEEGGRGGERGEVGEIRNMFPRLGVG